MLRTVELSMPVFLLPGGRLHQHLNDLRPEYPAMPNGFSQIVTDLAAQRDGVPAILTEWSGSRTGFSLQLHTYTYTVKLAATNRIDAYRVTWAEPLRLPDHDRLARGCLLIRAVWRPVAELPHIPAGASAGWPEVFGAWQQLQADLGDADGVPTLTEAHTEFLDTLDRLNETEHRLNTENAADAPTFPYAGVEPVGERRDSAAGRYVFRVVGGAVPERNAYVQVRGRLKQRGQVTRVTGEQVTVRFDEDVDWETLPRQGELLVSTTDISYAKRREAIGLLRSRQTRNRTLLDVLVEQRVGPIEGVDAVPGEELDPDQLAAFNKALGVRDLLVVLGPPGTGKTRTISQIARAHALRGNRDSVLISSHTNRAVDNVLAKLPVEVNVIRVGNEGKVDQEVKPFLLEQRAADLRDEAVNTIDAALGRYVNVPHAKNWCTELGLRIEVLDTAMAGEREWQAEWTRRRRAAGGPAQERVDGLAARVADLDRAVARAREKAERLGRRTSRILRRWYAGRRAKAELKMAALLDEIGAARTELADAERAVEAITLNLPEVREARTQLDDMTRQRAKRCSEALDAGSAIIATVGPLLGVGPVRDTGDIATTRAALGEFHRNVGPRLALLAAREVVLGDWRQAVSGATEQLYPELVRYADVVGATCIGAASRREIAEEQFDLAIIDEAGQIATTDVLVPLVRARRAVLVGDHRQLPPIADGDVLALQRDPAARELVERSALENLVGRFPVSHKVMLTRQRRMPRVIADFVSSAFYDGRLETMVTRTHDDVIFTSPFAFVDTSDQPTAKRRERRAGTGVENEFEADLLATLAVHYQRRRQEWALIVPYRAQLKLIGDKVLARIPDQAVVESNIGTVDSFQGGERDVILYGFTRSNPGGHVGFLDELRRANVAFTRAKRQLVLVGDLDMLVRANSAEFRQLMGALREHVRVKGDLRPSAIVRARLDELERRA